MNFLSSLRDRSEVDRLAHIQEARGFESLSRHYIVAGMCFGSGAGFKSRVRYTLVRPVSLGSGCREGCPWLGVDILNYFPESSSGKMQRSERCH